ncbi:ABC transporter permease [uncultured Tyzzerella sp.]|uniref:ABC transporter permease n=1 Tax=uncultured Tyzzerella sp. TaxID=2321398 RepID=UPI0029437F83|nr:ABC transporter permease [uncultured Tyzzerella sp.]
MKKFQNIINKNISALTVLLIIILWQVISYTELVPKFMLPSPVEVVLAFIKDFKLIFSHIWITLLEAAIGLSISIIFSFILAIIMDKYKIFDRAIYPILVISQTVPTVAIAPIIVLWFGFGIMPKILLIFSTCFFPMTISILTGFKDVDEDMLKLMKSMDSSYIKTLFIVKIPLAMQSFFSGLKIAATYAIVGAVVSEWLGGEKGIGVYMTRVKKSYAFDKMFASIIIISLLSLLLVWVIRILEKKIIYWKE